jgi:chromosomal replication initiation ATPase DnaA
MSEADQAVLRIDPRPPGGLKAMAAEVYAYYGLDTSELLSTSRSRRVTHPRHAFMWHARQVKWPDGENRYSLPMIGAFLGMDHTSVLHGERAHKKRLAALSTDINEVVDAGAGRSAPLPQISAGIAA